MMEGKKIHSHSHVECDMRNECYVACARQRRYKMIQIIVDALKRAIWRIPQSECENNKWAKCVGCVLCCNLHSNAPSFPDQLIKHRCRFIFQLPVQHCGIFVGVLSDVIAVFFLLNENHLFFEITAAKWRSAQMQLFKEVVAKMREMKFPNWIIILWTLERYYLLN